jgi:N-hydroxyarylamine O-acetyltransferase
MCGHHQTSPASHFTQNVVCTLPTLRGRRTLSGRTLILDDDARTAALATHFGIRLPAVLRC